MKEEFSEINRLNFEDIIWIIFILLSILNIISNKYQKEYILNKNKNYENISKKISIFILIILIFIYLYFFKRNYHMYSNKDNLTKEDTIKLLGSFLFVIGTFCLLYFQINSKDNFIDSIEE